ncbi:MAG: penicillin-binding protein 2 [Gemmobacter sp.]
MRRPVPDTGASLARIGRRALLIGGLQAGVVGVLGWRLYDMQGRRSGEFRLMAEENRISIRLIPPVRGLIHDRNNVLIAGNEQNYRIVITREDAGDMEAALARLGSIIALDPDDVERTLRESRRRGAFVPIIVTDRLSWDEVTAVGINAPALPGISAEVGQSRIYPLGPDFVHVVGYVGPVSERDLERYPDPDPVLQIPKFQIGKIGVERWREDALRGRAGSRRVEVNAAGRIMRELDRRDGQPGDDLRLSIEAGLQNFVQERLAGESAAAVVMDVTNGDLLAVGSAPSFDPNLFVRGISSVDYDALLGDEFRPLANKAVQGLYPPGSTYKMITALAALEAGAITPETGVYCPGHLDASGRRFHCWKGAGHGQVALAKAISESCDVYFYDIAQRVGIEAIAAMAERFGLGERHDLPMSAVAAGLNPTRSWKREQRGQDWMIGDTINASIGQGYVLSSPLQLAVMTARLATGRKVVPRLVVAAGGREIAPAPAPLLGLTEGHLRAIRASMSDATNTREGTAWAARVVDPALRIAGKTGTSQVRNITAAERARGVTRNEDLPRNRRDHALYVAFAPVEAPRVAVSVVVEHGGGGAGVAAPIARDIVLRALTGDLPPLSAYPENQRGRIEADIEALRARLRPPAAASPTAPGGGDRA